MKEFYLFMLNPIEYFRQRRKERAVVNIKSAVEDYQSDLLGAIFSKYSSPIDLVSEANAMKVPAVINGVNFLAGTVAGLPIQAFVPEGNGAKPAGQFVNRMLNKAWNLNTSSFSARFSLMVSVLLHGRGFVYLARNMHNVVRELHVLDQSKVQEHPTKSNYWLLDVNGLPNEVSASDIIYIPFLVSSYNPKESYGLLKRGARAINICLAIEEYLSGYFDSAASGNFAAEAPVKGKEAYEIFKERISDAVSFMKRSGSRVLTLPAGTNFTTISNDSRRSQLVENRVESVRQIARLLTLPPIVLAENSGTTWSLQDIDRFLAMHTIKRWKNAIEQEFTLKLFPNITDQRYISLDLSELQKAMLADRITAHRIAINSAQLTPNEARAEENRPEYEGEGGDTLYMQSATVPLENLVQEEEIDPEETDPEEEEETDPEEEEETDPEEEEEEEEEEEII